MSKPKIGDRVEVCGMQFLLAEEERCDCCDGCAFDKGEHKNLCLYSAGIDCGGAIFKKVSQ